MSTPTPTPAVKGPSILNVWSMLKSKWTTIAGAAVIIGSIGQFLYTQKPPETMQDWIQLVVGIGLVLSKDHNV